MKLTAPYKCDYCGKLKEASNHWWLRRYSEGPEFLVVRWDDADPNTLDIEHICGQDCATKALAKWMAAQ